MQDALRPSDDEFKRVYAAGYQTWLDLYSRAVATPLGIPQSRIASAFPSHPYLLRQLELDKRSPGILQATGRTVWETSDNKCDLPPFTTKTVLRVTAACAIQFVLEDGCSNSAWNQFGGDHVPILTLAWAYVLSARWVEIIPGAKLEYTDSLATCLTPGDTKCSDSAIQVGDIDVCALRWWQAVLAPGEGWDASVLHNRQHLKSPWSLSLSAPRIQIMSNTKPTTAHDKTPASYAVATGYILDYVAYHAVDGQSRAAFAAALLLPTRHFISKTVHWTRPRFPGQHRSHNVTTSGEPPWGVSEQQLDKLLTLSCNTLGTQTILSSSFIKPDLPYNICGAWLQGAFAVLDAPSTQEPATLARMLMRKSPHLDFLWLGAIIMGAQHYITKWARTAGYLIDLQAAAWTDTEHHSQAPLVPFTPFGSIAIRDCTLDVQLHACCAGRHGLRYAGMSWDCMDNTTISQNGTAPLWNAVKIQLDVESGDGAIPYGNPDRDRDVSPSLTRNFFTWLRDIDGYPVAERAIREHPWIADEFSSSDESDMVEGDARSTMGRNLGAWLSKGATARSYSL